MSDSEGIMIFKDTMEYLINGEINEMQYAYLTKLIYETRWGNGVDDNTIEDRDVRMIWKTLKHSVKKSKTNAEQYAKNRKKAPNKPEKTTDDIVIPQEEESASEALKQGEFDNVIEEFENNKDDMGNYIGYIPNFSAVAVETRKEVTEFDIPKFIEYLKENNHCLYTKMLRTPSRGLSVDANMKKLEESLDTQLQIFLTEKTKRQQLYIYLIENNS